MQVINCWSDLRPYGIDVLTGEACGLGYRVLCDVTEKGRQVLRRLWSLPKLELAERWNAGSEDEPHVGSIMLSREMLAPIGIFALLESGCTEAWLQNDGTVVGFDGAEHDEAQRARRRGECVRSFAYRGTAGDRNMHMMSGRTQ
jgi:hypothetical protein